MSSDPRSFQKWLLAPTTTAGALMGGTIGAYAGGPAGTLLGVVIGGAAGAAYGIVVDSTVGRRHRGHAKVGPGDDKVGIGPDGSPVTWARESLRLCVS